MTLGGKPGFPDGAWDCAAASVTHTTATANIAETDTQRLLTSPFIRSASRSTPEFPPPLRADSVPHRSDVQSPANLRLPPLLLSVTVSASDHPYPSPRAGYPV
jgi:hypothetical protein